MHEFQQNVLFRFGGAAHYTWNKRNRLILEGFSVHFVNTELDRAKMKLAIIMLKEHLFRKRSVI